MQRLLCHSDGVSSLSIDDTGCTLVSGSWDCTMKVPHGCRMCPRAPSPVPSLPRSCPRVRMGPGCVWYLFWGKLRSPSSANFVPSLPPAPPPPFHKPFPAPHRCGRPWTPEN